MNTAIETRSHADQALLGIPNPKSDPVGEARTSYTRYYKLERQDSHPESHYSLAQRIGGVANSLQPGGFALDLGAGRQIFEDEHAKVLTSHGIKIVTLDVADLTPEQLLARENPDVHHIQASGSQLPFADNTFATGFSNLAFDFMPTDTRHELFRVMKPGSPVFLNLHHPDAIIPEDLDKQLWDIRKKVTQQLRYKGRAREEDVLTLASLRYKVYQREHRTLFYSGEQISTSLAEAGFVVNAVRVTQTRNDKFWEVDLTTPLNKPKMNATGVVYTTHQPQLRKVA